MNTLKRAIRPGLYSFDGPSTGFPHTPAIVLSRRYPRHPSTLLHAPSFCSNARLHSANSPPAAKDTSIFSDSESPWDRVFADIEDVPPLVPPVRGARGAVPPEPARPSRRHTMTHREMSAFDHMFDEIFAAVEHSGTKTGPAVGKHGSLASALGIGQARSDVGDLFGRLRRQSKRLKWTTEADAELDRKKEELELCDTDQQVLEWALREVFAESERYEARARRLAADADPARANEPAELQPATYPHLLALLMRTFRDKYADPHLALAVFDHARHLSIASFVFGCTTAAYNELVETRWRCFRDVRGVCDALEEMRVNGVEMDGRTRMLAEMIRREVGERSVWQEESSLGSGEVWEMVARIERLTTREPQKQTWRGPRSRRWTSDQETWQSRALQDDDADGWQFGQWTDNSPVGPPNAKQRRTKPALFGLR